MMARILRHRATLFRCWLYQQDEAGDWFAILHSTAHGEEARTETGTLFLVRDAVLRQELFLGVPVCPFSVRDIADRRQA